MLSCSEMSEKMSKSFRASPMGSVVFSMKETKESRGEAVKSFLSREVVHGRTMSECFARGFQHHSWEMMV